MSIQDSPFLSGMIGSQDMDRIRRSKLWPIVLALHYNTDKQLFCLKTNQVVSEIWMGGVEGLYVLRISDYVGEGEIEIKFTQHGLSTSGKNKPFLKSKNVKYIVQKLGDPSEKNSARKELEGVFSYRRQEGFIQASLQELLSIFKNNEKPIPSDYDQRLEHEESMRALRYIFQPGAFAESDPVQVLALQKKYEAFLQREKLIEGNKKSRESMFLGEKFLVVANTNEKYFLCSELHVVHKVPREIYNPATQFYPAVVHPLRRYNSLDGIDPEYKDVLMGALAFWKVYREMNNMRCTEYVDDYKFLPNLGGLIYPELSIMTHQSGYITKYLINKPGEHNGSIGDV